MSHHRHFKHLHVPEHWEQYWSKYPNGYTVLEALINWTGQVNDMVDSQNRVSDQMTALQIDYVALEKELRMTWNAHKEHNTKTYADFTKEIYTIINNWIATIESTIQDEVVTKLDNWLADGTLADIINNDVFNMKANQTDLDAVNTQLEQMLLKTKETYYIGVDGDFETINEAIEFLSIKNGSFVNGESTKIDLILKSGFVVKEQVFVDGLNLSYITLKSEDDEVIINRASLVKSIGRVTRYPAFLFNNGATSFVFDVLFNMDTTGESEQRNGIYGRQSSTVLMAESSGVKNAGSRGLHLSSSKGHANLCVFTGCGEAGIRLGNNSYLMGEGTDVSNSNRGLLISFSKIDFAGGIANNCEIGVRCVTGEVNFLNGAAENCVNAFSIVEQGQVNAPNGSYKNATGDTVFIGNGSTINISGSDLSGGKLPIRTSSGSTVIADSCNLVGLEDLSLNSINSIVSIESSTHKRISVGRRSTVNAYKADATAYTGASSVVMVNGGGNIINATDVIGYTIPGTANTISPNGTIYSNVLS